MTPAQRYAKRELRKLGCDVVHQTSDRIEFRMPSGVSWVCSNRAQLGRVKEVVENTRNAVSGKDRGDIESFPAADEWPSLSWGDVTLTPHSTDRVKLMLSQNPDLSVADFGACFSPETVRSLPRGLLAYVRGPLALLIDVEAMELVTVYWRRAELWKLFPRPEKVGTIGNT